MDLLQNIEEAVAYIKKQVSTNAKTGIILGTGLGKLVESIEVTKEIAYRGIPHFVSATVEYHAGKLIFGKLAGKEVICMSGRFHLYEGHSLEQVTFPVRVLKALGCENLLISNVAGALNPSHKLGDIMCIEDHLNLLGTNPLIGKNYDELGPRWPDMFEPYSQELIATAEEIGKEKGLPLQKGVYACMSGPSLETRAEYKMLSILGADAIGMSTVPEVIVAVHAGMKVFACSILTDLCYEGVLEPANIARIIEVAGEAEPKLVTLFEELIKRM